MKKLSMIVKFWGNFLGQTCQKCMGDTWRPS